MSPKLSLSGGSLILFGLLQARTASALGPPEEFCLTSCQLWLNRVGFSDTDPGAPFLVKQCQSALRIKSLYLCADVYCTDDDSLDGLRLLNETCQAGLNTSLPPLGIIVDYTEDEIANIPRVEPDDAAPGSLFHEVVLPSTTLYHLAFDTLDAWAYVHGRHILYGKAMFMFWGGAILASLVFRQLSALISRRARAKRTTPRRELQDEECATKNKKPGLFEHSYLLARRLVTVPATFGYRCLQNVGWCTIPPRIESLTILVFIVLNVVFCSISYKVFAGNLFFPSTSKQAWRYVSDRTGIISYANFPIIWLFGMRNNLLMRLTGWDFGTFNNYHRWIARVATLQAVVHSIGYTVLVFRDGGWPYFMDFFSQLFWWTGEIATVAMCALLAASVFWLRRNKYEGFLVLHIVLSAIVLITMLGHVSIFNGTFDGPFWACVWIWILDRALRLGRILAFNLRFWGNVAQMTYDSDSNTIRLVIPCQSSLYKPKAGTYYYIYGLDDHRPWESHPFTMAYTTPVSGSSQDERVALLREELPREPCMDNSSTPTMTFLIRPYDSFTSRIRDSARSGHTSSRVLVEGPYGSTQPLDQFDHVVFIVGGSGIVVPLSYLEQLNRTGRVKSVRVIWSVREPEFVQEVLQKDLAANAYGGKVVFDVFLTKGTATDMSTPSGLPKEATVSAGRPDIMEEVEYVAEATKGESVAIVACGPAKMADDSRRAVVTMLDRGFHRIEYFQEAFNW